MEISEIILVLCSLLLLLAYHIRLIWMIKHHPLRTDIGINNCLRVAWVRHIIDSSAEVLAVQTLRNTLMTVSLLASTAILLVAGILSFTLSASNLENFNYMLNTLGSEHPHVTLWRLLILIFIIFFAFFNFLLTLRYYNLVGFMLNTGTGKTRALPEVFIVRNIQRGSLHHTLGLRALFFTLPSGLWIFGPLWLLLGSVLLLLILWPIDYPTPEEVCHVQRAYKENNT